MSDIINLLLFVVSAIAAIGGVYFVGTRKGKASAKEEQAERQAKADARTHTKAKEARDEVDGMSDADVLRRLRERSGK